MKTFQDGDPLFGAMMHAIANLWPNGTAVLSGCAPTGSGSARQVAVAAGTVVINGAVVSVSQQTKTLDAATFDRYDLVSVNASGQAVVTKGVDTRRVPPVPANSVPIAICLVETGATTLPADRIYDARMDALRVSALTIDADKDWNGKNITNLGYIAATRIRSEASDTVRYGPKTGNISLTIPSIYMPGSTVRIKFHVVSPYINDRHYSNTATLKIDGVVVATVTPPFDNYDQTSTDYVGDHTVNGGSTITLTSTRPGDTSGITISCTDTAPVTYPAPPTWPS